MEQQSRNSRPASSNMMLAANQFASVSEQPNPYALATGPSAVRRLHLLHKIYAPAGRRVLLEAGLKPGMRVADFGCGVGVVSRMLAEIVGPSGSVVGIDVDGEQLKEAAHWCSSIVPNNCSFTEASADNTGLPRNSFDLVYCRFLLLHLPDPIACLTEMRAVLKPGGILVVEDGDLRSAGSVPPTAQDEFANLFGRFGPLRGLNYSLANNLYHLARTAGFVDARLQIHQPALLEHEDRHFLQWSVAEAGPAFVKAGVTSSIKLGQKLHEMQQTIDDANVLILAPRMSILSARKPA